MNIKFKITKYVINGLIVIAIMGCGAIVGLLIPVKAEPQIITQTIEVPVEKIVTQTVEVPIYIDREVIVEKPVEVVKEVYATHSNSSLVKGCIAPKQSTNIKIINNTDDTHGIVLSGVFEFQSLKPTGSMKPVMDSDTIVIVSQEQVAIGDFAVYKRADGVLILHQIIREDGDYWIFQGTNNINSDSPVLKSDVLYRVVALVY